MNQNFECKVDNTAHKSLADLNVHLRKLKWKQSDYYEKFYPKRDLFTGEKIPFKDYFSYWKTDFLNKNNLKSYCKNNPEKGVKWMKKFLNERAEEKRFTFAPSHLELRTLNCPSVHFLEENGGYNNICASIGLLPRFDYSQELRFKKLPCDCVIYQDTREQKPLPLIRSQVKTLNFGDYALDERYCKKTFIERKSLGDFVGTLGKGYERFYREVNRAKAAGAYLVVLVEEDFNKSHSFDKDWKLKKYVQISPAKIFKNVRDLLHEFDNLQFIFAKGRDEATRLTVRLFELENDISKVDLQFSYEKKLI
jgi:hypothetical protein